MFDEGTLQPYVASSSAVSGKGTLTGTEVGMRCYELPYLVPLGCCHD